MKTKKLVLALLSVWGIMATSCQDVEPLGPTKDIGIENETNLTALGRLKFKSVADLSAAIQEVSIMRAYNADGNHKKKLEKKFFDSWRFGISLNLTNFASSWKSWLNFVNGMSINDPKLICGEVRVAASLDNKWGGMTITKKTR